MSRGPQSHGRSADTEFESLVAAALRTYETSGDAGLARLYEQHSGHATRLRSELDHLRAAGLAGTLANAPPVPAAAAPRIAGYEVVRSLGAGGMGEVYLARQVQPVERIVALKVVRAGVLDEAARARFLVERQALSRMQHESIAHVYDAGTTPDGAPYFTMEYVAGEPFSGYCDRRSLPLRARLDLLCRVCDAVQHAHRNGVIHRDLKPGNVLVTERDGAPLPKVIDFGLAKFAGGDAAAELTRSGIILGTLEYMSPEQGGAGPDAIDTRADVYSLGVMLYEQLTGTPPLPASSANLLDYLRRLAAEEPPRPSERVRRAPATAEIAARRGHRGAATLARALRGDLDWIALRALAKQRDRRYQSVADLGADIRRHLGQLPVQARPPSLAYRTRKFVLRHRVAVAAAAAVAAVAVAGLWRELINIGEMRRRDARYDQLALGPRLDRLTVEGDNLLRPPSGGCPDVAALRGWLRAADAMLADRGAAGEPRAAAAGVILDARDQWLRNGLEQLDKAVTEFTAATGPHDRVQRHLAWSAQVEEVTLRAAAPEWQAAIASIADRDQCPAYNGLCIEPQLGLIPLRRNPATGLWEFRFWHPEGEAARFDATDRIENGAGFDPVLVLLPGGTFPLGSADDDELAAGTEKPRHEVTLEPFFIGKHELTRGQWRRWTGTIPAAQSLMQSKHPTDDSHPVGYLDWWQTRNELWAWGLRQPTEAQWEYAARAGTTTPWWTGPTPASLAGRVNLADGDARAGDVPAPWWHGELRDGYPLTAPVDALAANAFGLHHVLGNVWEWCAGEYGGNYSESGTHRPGDGLFVGSRLAGEDRVVRGGSYLSTWILARCATRVARGRSMSGPESGVRPARPLLGVTPAGATR